MNLYLLRHGIAEEASETGVDTQRRLTAAGIKKMRRNARGMKALEMEFDLILSSPWRRARETAEIVAETFKPVKLASMAALAGNGNPHDLVTELNKQHRRRQGVLLVGHEPYLGHLISLLVAGDTDAAITLKKGGLCCLSVKTLRYGRCAKLEWLLTPRQMRLMA